MKKKRVNEPYEISTRTGSDVFNYRHWKNKLRTNKRGEKKEQKERKEKESWRAGTRNTQHVR